MIVMPLVLLLFVVACTIIMVLGAVDRSRGDGVEHYERQQERELLREKVRQSNEAMRIVGQIRHNHQDWRND